MFRYSEMKQKGSLAQGPSTRKDSKHHKGYLLDKVQTLLLASLTLNREHQKRTYSLA